MPDLEDLEVPIMAITTSDDDDDDDDRDDDDFPNDDGHWGSGSRASNYLVMKRHLASQELNFLLSTQNSSTGMVKKQD